MTMHECLSDALAAAQAKYSWARIKNCAICGKAWVSLDTKSRHCLGCAPIAANATKRAKADARIASMIAYATNCGCVEWPWQLNDKGYGMISIDGKGHLAHRWIYQKVYGDIPSGLDVMHICDNPPCVNHYHLRLGTRAENTLDMYAKGRDRKSKGVDHWQAKLTDDAVREIRASNETLVVLAARYGVSFGVVSKVRRRLLWKHVP